LVLCLAGICLGVVSYNGLRLRPETAADTDERLRLIPVPGDGKTEDLNRMEQEWQNRITYPTGIFNADWLRQAAAQDARIDRRIPAGIQKVPFAKNSPLALAVNSFTA